MRGDASFESLRVWPKPVARLDTSGQPDRAVRTLIAGGTGAGPSRRFLAVLVVAHRAVGPLRALITLGWRRFCPDLGAVRWQLPSQVKRLGRLELSDSQRI